MASMTSWPPTFVAAAVIALAPLLALAFAGDWVAAGLERWSVRARLGLPAIVGVVYWLVVRGDAAFRWVWFATYVGLPVVVAWLSWEARRHDPEQKGTWRDLVILLVLGLIVEFRLFESAWPRHFGGCNRLLLLDTGLYAFLVIRRLNKVGFNFLPKVSDFKTALRELVFYAPIAAPLGLGLRFLHAHGDWPGLARVVGSWVSILLFVALLEETYFRGWWQNLLERRLGRNWALLATAALFGLSHFNKGATHFNWRYVLLASLAGIFYGRAWREKHRLMASAITHASVDTIWLLWFRG